MNNTDLVYAKLIYNLYDLTRENAVKYVEQYGAITDPELAKSLLCVTSNAWFILDDPLKRNSDVIMYYQPMAKHRYEIGADYGAYEPIASAEGLQKGFCNIKGNKCKNYAYDVCLFPTIIYPKDFDYELYANIQYEFFKGVELYTNHTYSIFSSRISPSKKKLLDNIEFDDRQIDVIINGDYYGYFSRDVERIDDEDYVIYDRSRLREIVETLSKAKQLKKI